MKLKPRQRQLYGKFILIREENDLNLWWARHTQTQLNEKQWIFFQLESEGAIQLNNVQIAIEIRLFSLKKSLLQEQLIVFISRKFTWVLFKPSISSIHLYFSAKSSNFPRSSPKCVKCSTFKTWFKTIFVEISYFSNESGSKSFYFSQ